MSGRQVESLAAPVAPGEEERFAEFDEATRVDGDAPDDKRSVIDDIEAFIDDIRTYFDAELSYQKSRAAFVAVCLKKGAGFIVAALMLAFLATIALTVGLVIALTPLITAWGATAVVVLVYLLVALLLIRAAIRAFKGISLAINEHRDGEL